MTHNYRHQAFARFFLLVSLTTLLASQHLRAQQVNLEQLNGSLIKQPVKVGGGISASTIFYGGNDGQGRQPFTYFLNGSLNLRLFNQINLPFNFNLTNLGNNFSYPTLPNRLSLHPTYKWITGHIGDVAMSFSPYTLNGHMFRGAGVDLSPKGPWKLSMMAGRLQQKVAYNPANRLVPAAYARSGYGAKARYEQAGYQVGMSFFRAQDDAQSLEWPPDSLNILPQSNVAMSWEGGVKLTPNLSVSGEYGLSMLTRDVRAPREGTSLLNHAFANRTSTQTYRSLRGEVNYQLLKNTIGIGYERIDPDYATLGAYYFNNDYENVTLQFARPFLKDKLAVALSWGAQRDDLNNTQQQASTRLVSSANVTYTPNEKLNASLAYSNFQTYLNIRSQFDYINGQTPYDNLDTLNFTQLSQNLSVNTLYSFGKTETKRHQLNTSLSYQEAADKQGEIIRPGKLSRFYNLNTAYSWQMIPQLLNIQAAFNATHSYQGGQESITLGPTLALRAKVWHKKVTTGLSSSYNVNLYEAVARSKVLNLRWNATYALLKKHNLSANAVWQTRKTVGKPTVGAVTTTLAYAYQF
jgi:hypothetical protein